MKLKISETLSLPDNAATQKIAFIGRTGSGKSYGAGVLVEKLLRAEQQVVILDPVGIWYGLRLDANGKDPGFSIPVLGGLHGDIPLEPTGGALVADLIVDRGISVVLDVSQFESDADKARFAAGFADRFYWRKKASQSAVHLVIEECQEFIPQNPQKGEERMLHAFQRMWKLGRNFGIGGSLITQRPQEVSKKALNQTELVFAFQLTGPQERKAMALWLSDKGGSEELADSLPSLQVGTCYAWSPQWLSFSERITFLTKLSFDASSTPKAGAKKVVTASMAEVDLADLQEKMKETVERAKADDPKALRAEINKLRANLEILDSRERMQVARPAPLPERVEIAVLTPDDREMLNNIANEIGRAEAELKTANMNFQSLRDSLELRAAAKPVRHTENRTIPFTPHTVAERVPVNSTHAGRIGKGGMQRMMIAIAQRPGLGRRQLGVRAGLSSTSGSFNTYLSIMRKNGWISEDHGGFVITTAGVNALGFYNPLPEGRDLFEYWANELGDGGASRILRALQLVSGMSREQLGQAAEMSHTSGSFNTYLSKLRSLELIEGRDIIKLSDELR